MIPEYHRDLIPWSRAWLDLYPRSRDVYLAICAKSADSEAPVTFPWGEARERLRIGKGTFWRAIKQLLSYGWIERTHKGRFPCDPSTYSPSYKVVQRPPTPTKNIFSPDKDPNTSTDRRTFPDPWRSDFGDPFA